MNRGKWGFYKRDTNEPVDIDISSAIALPLKWSISFRYTASDKSKEVLTCKNPTEKTVFYGEKRYLNENEMQLLEYECTVKKIKLSPTGGTVDIEFFSEKDKDGDVVSYGKNIFDESGKNEYFLILSDGSEIPVTADGRSANKNDGIYYMTLNILYKTDDDFQKRFLDISDVKAFRFNGTDYPVE